MNFHEIPEYDDLEVWQTANGQWEVKLFRSVSKNERESVLHLSEDEDAENNIIEDGKFYLDVTFSKPSGLRWIRERLAIEMPSGMDADYVHLREDGRMKETQHNHQHLDRDVQKDRSVALTPV